MKHYKLLCFLLVFVCCLDNPLPTLAQHMSPSEMRKKKQQEEEDKKKEEGSEPEESDKPSERRSKNKTTSSMSARFSDDKKFDVTAIPDKWKKESAVVIYQKQEYSYLRNNKVVEVDEIVRKRIKLIDKAAVKEFSELFYIKGSEGSEVGVSIVKADGKKVKVSTDKAVEVSEGIPQFYKAYYLYLEKYYKLAIPDLEPGDILDYFYYNHREISNATIEYAFAPFTFTLSSTYPILSQAFTFKVDRGFFINFNSYNGAPALKEGEAGTDLHGRKRAMIKQYELTDSDREKLPKDIWNYKFRTSAVVKFQVMYESGGNKDDANAFIGEIGEAKETVTPEEVQKFIGNKVRDEIGTDYAGDVLSYLNKKMPHETNPEKIARAAYYYLRYKFLDYYYVTSLALTYDKDRMDYFTADDYKFASILLQVFKKKEITAEVVATVPRSQGTLKDLLLRNELSIFIRVKSKGNDLYLFPFHNHSTFDYSDDDLEGVEGIAFTPVRNPKVFNYKKVNIPVTDSKKNLFACSEEVTLDDQFENISIKKTSSMTGLYKSPSSSGLYLHNYDYLTDEQRKYNPKFKESSVQRGNKTKVAEEKRKKESAKEDKEKAQMDRLKSDLEEDFDVVSYDNYEVLNPGRFDEDPVLKYKEEFKVKGLVNKAGKNYIFEIGKLIGKQIELKEEDMKRTTDVYLSFAKTITNEISVTLPAGYKAEGLNEMNFNVDNECCAFISTAKQEGNVVKISTQKIYKKNFEKKENWGKMSEALEAAYKFTQKKVILKKA